MGRIFQLLQQHSGFCVRRLDQCQEVAGAREPCQGVSEMPEIVGNQHAGAYETYPSRHSFSDQNADADTTETEGKGEGFPFSTLRDEAAIKFLRKI